MKKNCGVEEYPRAELKLSEKAPDFTKTELYKQTASQPVQVLISVLTLAVAVITLWKK